MFSRERIDRDEQIIRKRATIDFLQKSLIYLCVLILAVSLGAILVDLQSGKQQRDLILSCTTPQGACFKEGQARTKEAVTSIDTQNQARSAVTRQISVYAAYCSQLPNLETVNEFESCIRRLLKIEGDSFNYQEQQEGGKKNG